MTAPLFYQPFNQPLDANGNPMPGCYWQFYATQTTTPTDTYADSALNTALSNPVVSDSAGRFVPIYLDPTTLYRARLRDADDNLIIDVDPIIPAPGRFVGETVLYHGNIANIPAGWQRADGTNSTLDARDRFPVGAGSTYAHQATGGAASASGTTGAAGGHNHGGATASHTLTVAEIPAHEHGQGSRGSNASSNGSGDQDFVSAFPGNGGGDTETVGGGGGHAHDITAVADHTHSISSISTVPPYVGYYIIEYVGA